MKINILLELIGYISIGVAVVILIVGYFLLHKFVLVGHKNRRLQSAITHKYNYAHNLLLNEDSQHLRRIEAISDINLLMRPVYEEFYKRFEHLRDIEDRRASKAVQVLNEELVKGNKEYRNAYQDNRRIVNEYEVKVQILNRDLANVIKPETDIREKSIDDKKTFRIIKNMYRENKKELELVDNSFEKVFTHLERLFVQHEDALNGAFYDEANASLEKIRRALKDLEKVLKVLPLLCVKATETIPQKLDFVRKRYQELEKQGIPLPHLMVNAQLDKFNNFVDVAKNRLRNFDYHGIDNQFIQIEQTVGDLLVRFDDEVRQKNIFTDQFDKIYQSVNDIERRYIRLVNNMTNIKKVYLITEETDDKLEVISSKLNELSNTKRMLDSFTHSSTRQPYSVLVEKMMQLKDEYELAEKLLSEYFTLIDSLRADAERAHTLIKVMFFELKKSEAKLREMQVNQFADTLTESYSRCYMLIDLIAQCVKEAPINIDQVNAYADELNDLADRLIETVNQESTNANLAEATIVYLNRYRNQYSDVQTKLTDEEIRFFNGSFTDVSTNCADTVKHYSNREKL